MIIFIRPQKTIFPSASCHISSVSLYCFRVCIVEDVYYSTLHSAVVVPRNFHSALDVAPSLSILLFILFLAFTLCWCSFSAPSCFCCSSPPLSCWYQLMLFLTSTLLLISIDVVPHLHCAFDVVSHLHLAVDGLRHSIHNGEHHGCGGGVGDPHGEEHCGEHEAQHESGLAGADLHHNISYLKSNPIELHPMLLMKID